MNVSIVRAASLLIVIGIGLVPSAALAGGRHAGGRLTVVVGSRPSFAGHGFGHARGTRFGHRGFAQAPKAGFGHRGFAHAPKAGFGHRGFAHSPFVHKHRGFHKPSFIRGFVPFVSSTAIVVSAPPPVFVGPPVAAVAVPPAPVVVAPPPPPMPRVVEYAHGRYELRGDGVTTPYVWVWIPNPPPPPPPPAPASPPAESQAPQAPPAARDASPARSAQIYCFTDEHGVTTWTDQLNRVPERYRAEARQANEGGASPRCPANS
ncbi:MAG: hypothetical protein HYU51_04210 [Candidatus Rokubacteria bacterium]|nr:hypothetical protein [Candidatus Rokubacteria bacterium]